MMNDTLSSIYQRIVFEALAGPRPCVIGINGLDCSGKTHFARGLAAYLRREGHAVALLHIDDYNDGDVQQVVYDAFTEGRFTAAHLDQFYAESIDYGQAAGAIRDAATGDGVTLVERVFLYKDCLNELFTYRVYLDVRPDEAESRYRTRREAEGDARPAAVFRELWLPSHRRYLAEYAPAWRADLIVGNDEFGRPNLWRSP